MGCHRCPLLSGFLRGVGKRGGSAVIDGKADVSSEASPRDLLALASGTSVGRYTITAVIGHGGFGITYRARDEYLGRDVAIKEYLPTALALRHERLGVLPNSTETADDFAWGRQRFLEEGRILATLQDAPAIVRVYDFLEANGTAYIVMELVRGTTLERRLKDTGPLSPREVERLVWPLLEGLAKVHEAGFVHRDIKPANILLSPEGHPVLVDFGASRSAVAARTSSMTAVFTPAYAAVEQFSQARQGPWTDIYSLSATLYHAIVGRAPPSALDRTLEERLQPLATVAPTGFKPDLLRAIDRGLSVRATDRPQSIAEWRPLFRSTATPVASPGTPQPAERDGLARAANLVPRKTRQAAWLLVLAAVILLGGGAYLGRSMFLGPALHNLTADELAQALDERRKADAAAAEKRRLEEEAARQAQADATAKRQADEALAAAQQQRQQAEEALARLKAEIEARRIAETRQREEAAAAAQRALEEAARKQQADAAIAALRRADEEAQAKAATEAAARRAAEQEAERKAEAEAEARRFAEEDARRKAAAEAEAKRQADEALARAQVERRQSEEAAARQKAELDAKKAEAEERSLGLQPIDRQRLQAALTSLGFPTYGVDGLFGPRSREMIAAWQKARNQPVTGFLTGAQQQALMKEGASAVARFDDERAKAEEAAKKAEAATSQKPDDARTAANSAAPGQAAVAPPPSPAPVTAPSSSAPAAGQDLPPEIQSALGIWSGLIVGCCNDSTARRLRIYVEGGRYRCVWAVSTQAFNSTKSCSVTAKEIRLVTGADTTVTFERRGDRLQGWFVVRTGNAFMISMTRVP